MRVLPLQAGCQQPRCQVQRHGFVQLFPEVSAVIAELGRRYVVGLVTNGNTDPERSGLPGVFAFRLAADHVGLRKPDHFLNAAVGSAAETIGTIIAKMDGLLLAARRDTLVARDVRFDERFLFHFYDLDFCRTARARGLKLGTWPLAVTHQSGGAFGSPGWKSAYQTYLAKWETSRKPA